MAGNEILLILALSAIFVLLKFYRRPGEDIEHAGTGLRRDPVRERPEQAYAPDQEQPG